VRHGYEMTMSDSHASYFTAGKVAIAVDGRFHLRTLHADAFEKITGIGAS